MNEIKQLSQLEENQVEQAVKIFVEGFYFTLKSVSKDKEKLRQLFKSFLNYTMTYAYLEDGAVIGFLGLADHQTRPAKLDKGLLTQVLGLSKFAGNVLYNSLSTAFEAPKAIGPQDILIDYITTSPEHRGKGVGTQLILFVRDTLGFRQIQLETYSKNKGAISLYKKMGFRTIKEQKSLMMKISGYGNLVTMRLE